MEGTNTNSLDIERPGASSKDVESRIRRMLGNGVSDSETQLALADALLDKGDDAEALRVLRQVAYTEPGCLRAYDRLVDTYTRLGRGVEASEVYHRWGGVLSQITRPGKGADVQPNDGASVPESVAAYYAIRAPEYDGTSSYMRPESSKFTDVIKESLQRTVRDRDAIEIACGTGYWTSVACQAARSVLATDFNIELVNIVGKKMKGVPNVKCQTADAYSLDGVEGSFGAAYAQFWWSHMPRSMIRTFLTALHSKLVEGAQVYFMDSMPYVTRGPRRLDDDGNVIEPRVLLNGEKYEVIKNFPTEGEIREALAGIADDVQYQAFERGFVWSVSYKVRKA